MFKKSISIEHHNYWMLKTINQIKISDQVSFVGAWNNIAYPIFGIFFMGFFKINNGLISLEFMINVMNMGFKIFRGANFIFVTFTMPQDIT